MPLRLIPPALSALFTAILCGCGGEEFEMAPVRGTVTCGGQPITSGSVSFSPIATEQGGNPGRTASGRVQPDGTFVLSTYEAGDGAIIGLHDVSWAPPEEGEDDEAEEGESVPAPAPRPAPARGRAAKVPCPLGGQAKAEVVDGENDLTIDLSPPGTGGGDEDD